VLFDDVYAAVPAHLREQVDEAKSDWSQTRHEGAILPFSPTDRRAAGSGLNTGPLTSASSIESKRAGRGRNTRKHLSCPR
jgi:hypothetical protein